MNDQKYQKYQINQINDEPTKRYSVVHNDIVIIFGDSLEALKSAYIYAFTEFANNKIK